MNVYLLWRSLYAGLQQTAITKAIGAVAGTGTEREGKSVAIYIPADSAKVAAPCAKQR